MFQALFEGWDFNRATAVVRSRQVGNLVKHSHAVFGEAVWNNEATCAGVGVVGVVEVGGLRCWVRCWSRRWVGVAGRSVIVKCSCTEFEMLLEIQSYQVLPWHGT